MRVNDVDGRYSSYEGCISFYSMNGVLPQTPPCRAYRAGRQRFYMLDRCFLCEPLLNLEV